MQIISEPVSITGSTLVVRLSSVDNTTGTNYVIADAIRIESIGNVPRSDGEPKSPGSKD
jgi:hypothetical protein